MFFGCQGGLIITNHQFESVKIFKTLEQTINALENLTDECVIVGKSDGCISLINPSFMEVVFTQKDNDFSRINSIKWLVSDSSIAICTEKGLRFAKFEENIKISLIH